MPTYTSTTLAPAQPLAKNSLIKKISHSGFSLIEILVTMFIIVLVFSLASQISFTDRHAVEEVLEKMERAVRFAQGEASLRNAMVRIHFQLDKEPVNWTVEYGPDDRFVIPVYKFESDAVHSEKEELEYRESIKKTNKSFNKITEFQDKEESFPEAVKLLGVGSTLEKKMVQDFETSIYFYPSGEKDDALIVLATDNEVIGLSIDAYDPEIKRQYITLEGVEDNERSDKQYQLAKEMYETWRKQ